MRTGNCCSCWFRICCFAMPALRKAASREWYRSHWTVFRCLSISMGDCSVSFAAASFRDLSTASIPAESLGSQSCSQALPQKKLSRLASFWVSR